MKNNLHLQFKFIILFKIEFMYKISQGTLALATFRAEQFCFEADDFLKNKFFL